MKICYVLPHISVGGQLETITSILRYSETRWNSTIVFHSQNVTPFPLKFKEVCQSGWYFCPFLERDVIRFMRASDIVQIKSGIQFLPAALLSGRPVIYTLHQPDPTWLFSGIQRYGRVAARLTERRAILGSASALVAISPWVRSWYRDHYGLDPKVIPDSFDLTFWGSTPRQEPKTRGPRLLAIGWDGLNGRKRTHDIIHAMPAILRRFPDASLSIVGLSPEGLVVLGGMLRKSSASERIQLNGYLTSSELRSRYRSADLFVSSTLVEGFYRPIIEAFASGLPSVVRDASELVDSVCLSALHHLRLSGGGTAWKTAAELPDSIDRALSQYGVYSVRAREYADSFDNSRILPRYEQLYQELIG